MMCQTDHDRIIGMLMEQTNKELDSLDCSIREGERELAAEISKCNELNKKKLELMEFIESLRNSPSPAEDELGQEFDKFFEIPEVIGVEIRDGMLMVYTRPIMDRGEFTMEFDLKPLELRHDYYAEKVRFMGTGGSRFHHAHITSEGRVCFGNVGHQMQSYLDQQQMFHAAVLGVEFLKS